MKGGKQTKNKKLNAQQALLDAIWHEQGGNVRVARKLGVHIQTPINWRNRGGVPLALCPRVAAVLGVYVWGLNYKDMVKFYEGDPKRVKEIPSWITVIKAYGLRPEVVRYIHSLESPIK